MKLLVFSDSHGNARPIYDALTAHAGTADAVIHLGDGTADMELVLRDYPRLDYICIAGNHEQYFTSVQRRSSLNYKMISDFGGLRFLLVHGHREGVKYGLDNLMRDAVDADAHVVLYGHTHEAYESSFISPSGTGKRIYMFNPGSVGCGYPSSYGVITIQSGVPVFSHAIL